MFDTCTFYIKNYLEELGHIEIHES